ncbi:hypothetical protein LINGRAHAP2_LOCUS16158 [Linum grandiflorum]
MVMKSHLHSGNSIRQLPILGVDSFSNRES